MDLLIDTNVLLDHFGNRPGFVKDANKVLSMGLFGDARLWVVPQSYNDIFYILRKAQSAKQIQNVFAKSLAFLHICSVNQADYQEAVLRCWDDMEDCLIALCAEKAHARFIVTRDADGFKKSAVPQISPPALLELMKQERGICYDDIALS